jgi:hypothetical protein
MHARTALPAALLALAALTGCGSSDSDTNADPAACKAAMDRQYVEARETGKEGSQPAECEGIDEQTLAEYAAAIEGEHITDGLNDAIDDAEQSMDEYDEYLDNLETATP